MKNNEMKICVINSKKKKYIKNIWKIKSLFMHENMYKIYPNMYGRNSHVHMLK